MDLAQNADSAAFEVGSAEHRRGLARFFIDTYIDYEPEQIRWPALGEAERNRLVGLPFWQEAVATESRTSGKVMAAAQLESDAELRKAIELQGFEENRHARLLAALTRHYRIPIQTPPPHVPRSLENEFLLAGFGECFDSSNPRPIVLSDLARQRVSRGGPTWAPPPSVSAPLRPPSI